MLAGAQVHAIKWPLSCNCPAGIAVLTHADKQNSPSNELRPAAWLLLPVLLCVLESWHLTQPSAPPDTNTAVLSGSMELTLLAWLLYGRTAPFCRLISRICSAAAGDEVSRMLWSTAYQLL